MMKKIILLSLLGCLVMFTVGCTHNQTVNEPKQFLQKEVEEPDGIIEPDKAQKKAVEDTDEIIVPDKVQKKPEEKQKVVYFTEILEEKIPRTFSRSVSLDYYKIEKEIFHVCEDGAGGLGIGIGMGMAFQEKDDKEEFLKIVPKDKVVNYTVTVNDGRGKCQFHFNCYYAESGLLTLYKETHEIENCISLIPDKEDTGKIIIVYEEKISDE